MGPLTIIYLLHNFHNSNYRIIIFFWGGVVLQLRIRQVWLYNGEATKRHKLRIVQFIDSRSQWPRGLKRRPAATRLHFEFHRGNGCLSVVSILCYQTEVSATS